MAEMADGDDDDDGFCLCLFVSALSESSVWHPCYLSDSPFVPFIMLSAKSGIQKRWRSALDRLKMFSTPCRPIADPPCKPLEHFFTTLCAWGIAAFSGAVYIMYYMRECLVFVNVCVFFLFCHPYSALIEIGSLKETKTC